jgi:hypothetical protein
VHILLLPYDQFMNGFKELLPLVSKVVYLAIIDYLSLSVNHITNLVYFTHQTIMFQVCTYYYSVLLYRTLSTLYEYIQRDSKKAPSSPPLSSPQNTSFNLKADSSHNIASPSLFPENCYCTILEGYLDANYHVTNPACIPNELPRLQRTELVPEHP